MEKKQVSTRLGQKACRRVPAHYEYQSEKEAVAEDEAAFETPCHTIMETPAELISIVRELIAKQAAEK